LPQAKDLDPLLHCYPIAIQEKQGDLSFVSVEELIIVLLGLHCLAAHSEDDVTRKHIGLKGR